MVRAGAKGPEGGRDMMQSKAREPNCLKCHEGGGDIS